MKAAGFPVSTRRYAIMIKATVKDGRLEVEVPADWPDGTEVEVSPLATGIQDDSGMMSGEEIARTVAAMDLVEPMEITATERAAWEAERAGRIGCEKARFAEQAESLRRIWE
jgi:hypothetical protein